LTPRIARVEVHGPGIEEAEQAASRGAKYDFVTATIVQCHSSDMDELVDDSSGYVSVREETVAIASAVLCA